MAKTFVGKIQFRRTPHHLFFDPRYSNVLIVKEWLVHVPDDTEDEGEICKIKHDMCLEACGGSYYYADGIKDVKMKVEKVAG